MQEKRRYDISYKSSNGRLVHMHKQEWSGCNGRAKGARKATTRWAVLKKCIIWQEQGYKLSTAA